MSTPRPTAISCGHPERDGDALAEVEQRSVQRPDRGGGPLKYAPGGLLGHTGRAERNDAATRKRAASEHEQPLI